MAIDVYLRNVKTGETGMKHFDFDYNPNLWDIGNYSCDCNRSLFLYDYNEDKELDCNVSDNVIVIDKIVDHETVEVLAKNL